MHWLLASLLCFQGLQGLLEVVASPAAGRRTELLRELPGILAASPPKAPLTRHVRSNGTDQDAWPESVLLGAGLSACQAEGAWNTNGKAESLMDFVQHVPGQKMFKENAEKAADHYHRFRDDLALAKEMKFNSHRFSISWSRVLPTGGKDNINEEGVQFYKDYIDEVIKNGMEPMVTMLHFDQPISLENATGGWSSSQMIDKYVEYADFLFETFGDKVKIWNTINEPNMYCNYFPNVMYMVGARPNEEDKLYKCMHNIILAHMKTYQLYTKKYKEKQKGKVGTSVLMFPATPTTTQSEDVMAAETFNQMFVGSILHPLVFGDYPPVLRYLVQKRDAEESVTESRLPSFTDEEKKTLAEGVTDFIALNIYSVCKASFTHDNTSNAQQTFILGPVLYDMPFVKVLREPAAVDESLMHHALVWIWSTYHVPIMISENGYGDVNGVGIDDTVRAAYHSANLRSLVRTMNEYDIDVIAYYAWSLLDIYEFTGGYSARPFGLIHVDYKTGSLNRTLKKSAQFFIDLKNTGRVPYVSEPDATGASAGRSPTITAVVLLSAVWLVLLIVNRIL